MVVLNSLGAIPSALRHDLNDESRAALLLAIAALGMKTSFATRTPAGGRSR